MKKVILGSLFSAALVVAAFSHAGSWQEKGHHGKARMAEQLELTAEQKAEFDAIHEQMHTQPNKRLMRFAMKDVLDLNPESSDYTAQVNELADKKAEEVRLAVIAAGDNHAKVYAILTPEQREKAKELKTQMREKRKERKEKGFKHHRGEK